ncbi:MAG: Ig-like domain-containing protein, partial [Thiohalomonadales bacterium]
MNKKSVLSLALIILPFFLLLASCGGGSSSALPPSDTVGPNATLVSSGVVTTGKTPLVVNFNEAIFSASKGVPDGMNMVLTEKISTNSIPGAVQINTENNQLTFFPAENLIVNVEYELTLSDIFDGANNRLQANNGANYVWSFRVSDYPIIQINNGTNSIFQQPRYATNAANNNVLAVWVEKSSTAYFLYTSIYSNRSWSQPELLDTIQSTARFISFLKDVSSNGLGFAVVWVNTNNIYASVYSNGSWLTSPQLNINNADSAVLTSTYHPITSPTANTAGEGYAIAWTEAKSAYASVYTNFKWVVATAVGNAPVTNSLRISSNGRGYAVVWTGNDPSTICLRGSQVFADIYSSAKGYWINTKNNYPTIISAGVDTLTLDTTQDAQQANVSSNGDSYLFHWYGSDQTQNGSFVHAAVFTQLDTETEQPQLDGPFKISNIGN